MSILCGNSNCRECYPQPSLSPFSAATWKIDLKLDDKGLGEILRSSGGPLFNFDWSSKPKEQPMSSEAQRIVADLQELDESEFSRISREMDNIKRRNKERIEENLDGVARMALMDKSTKELRPFIVAYFKDGNVSTTQGVELGPSNLVNENEEAKEYRVFTFGRDYPVSGTYYTMKRFEKALEDSIPYVLVYRKDED